MSGGQVRAVNLDAFIPEATGEPRPVTLRGETYVLPAEFPAACALDFQRGKPYDGLVALFGDKVDQAIAGLSVKGLEALVLAVASEVYGLDLGEASASPA